MPPRSNCPRPVAWTADELANILPRWLSSAFEAGVPADMPQGARLYALARARRRAADHDLLPLFRVR